ncbi:hypothetical protein Q7P37_002996 [Cladosporium fusiforme]
MPPSQYPPVKLPHPFLTSYQVRCNADVTPAKFMLTLETQPANTTELPEPLHSDTLCWSDLTTRPAEQCPAGNDNGAWARAYRSPQTTFEWSNQAAPSLGQIWNVVHTIYLAHPAIEYFRLNLQGADKDLVRHELLATGLAIEHPKPWKQVQNTGIEDGDILILRSAFWQGAASPMGSRPIWVVGNGTQGPARKRISEYPAMPEHQQLTMKFPEQPIYAMHPTRQPKPNPGSICYSRYIPELDEHFSLEVIDWQSDEHVKLFNTWQNDPRVAKGWNETGTFDEHREYLRKLHFDPHVLCLFGRFNETRFSYYELYWAKEDHYGAHYKAEDYDRGRHSLVGDASFRGSHRVNAWYSSCIHYCFLDDVRTANVVGEPKATGGTILSYENSVGLTIGKYVDLGHKRSVHSSKSTLTDLGAYDRLVGDGQKYLDNHNNNNNFGHKSHPRGLEPGTFETTVNLAHGANDRCSTLAQQPQFMTQFGEWTASICRAKRRMLKLVGRPERRWQPSSLAISQPGRLFLIRCLQSISTEETTLNQKAKSPKRKRYRRWPTDEIQLIKDLCAKGMSLKAIADMFPDRSYSAVCWVSSLTKSPDVELFANSSRRNWSVSETKKLVEMRKQGASWLEIQKEFTGNSLGSLKCLHQRFSHGQDKISGQRLHMPWTVQEIAQLQELASQGRKQYEIAKMMGRSSAAISSQWNKLRQAGLVGHAGVKLWSPEEDQLLSNMYRNHRPLYEIAGELGRSQNAAKSRWLAIRQLNPKDMEGPSLQWLSANLQVVNREREKGSTWSMIQKEYFPSRTAKSLSRAFRQATGIPSKKRQGLSSEVVQEIIQMHSAQVPALTEHKPSKSKPYTKDEIELFEKLYAQGTPLKGIADKMSGRTVTSVGELAARYRRRELHLVNMRRNGVAWEEIQAAITWRPVHTLKWKYQHYAHITTGNFQIPPPRSWTSSDTDAMLSLARQGKTQGEVATILGRSKGAVGRQFKHIHPEKRWNDAIRFMPEHDQQIIHMRKLGKTHLEIAGKLQRSVRSIKNRWWRIRPATPGDSVIAQKGLKLSSDDVQAIAQMREDGRSWEIIWKSRYTEKTLSVFRRAFDSAFLHHSQPQATKQSENKLNLSTSLHGELRALRGHQWRLKLSSGDLQIITQMQKDAESLEAIRKSKYPDTPQTTFRRAVNRALQHENEVRLKDQIKGEATSSTDNNLLFPSR